MIRPWWRLISLAALAVAFAGCGGCQQSTPPAEKPAAEPAAGSSTGSGAAARPPGGGTGSNANTEAEGLPTARALPTIAEGSKGGTAPGKKTEEEPEEAADEPEAEADCTVIADAEPDFGPPPLTVRFSVDFECSDGSGTVSWDFGDGSGGSSDATPTHTYGSAGDFTAIVRVTSADGLSATDELDISVDADAERMDEDED